jgi:hypothetical protein
MGLLQVTRSAGVGSYSGCFLEGREWFVLRCCSEA